MATILLVDNDPLQAYERKSILEGRFDDVQRVGDAAEALCLVEQPRFASKLGLVISGQDLHGIGGPAFVAELHTRMPSLPVLVLGGADESAADYDGKCTFFLPKPFTAEQMMTAASQLLRQCESNAA